MACPDSSITDTAAVAAFEAATSSIVVPKHPFKATLTFVALLYC